MDKVKNSYSPISSTLDSNKNLKNIFVGIIKDLGEIKKGFEKVNKLAEKSLSEKKKESTVTKQEKYKLKIADRQTVIKQRKVVKKIEKKGGDSGGGILSSLAGTLTSGFGIAKLLFLIVGAAGLIQIIRKTEIGKALINFFVAVGKAFFSVAKDLFSVLYEAIKESSTHIEKAFRAICSAIGDFFKFVVGSLTGEGGYNKLKLGESFKFFLNDIVPKIFYLFADTLKLALKFFTKLFEDNKEFIRTGFIKLVTGIFDILTSLINSVVTTLQSNKDQQSGIAQGLTNILSSFWELLKTVWKGEFKDAEGKTTTFGDKLLKWGLVWVGLKLGMLGLSIAAGRFGFALSGLFKEMDSAAAMRCCCKDMADNLLDTVDDIDPRRKKPTTPPGRKPSLIEKMKSGVSSAKTAIAESRVGRYTAQVYRGIVSSKPVAYATEFVGKAADAGKRVANFVTDWSGRVWQWGSDKAAKMASSLEAGYKAAKNKTKDMAMSLYRTFVAAKNSPSILRKISEAASKSIIANAWKKVWAKVSVALVANVVPIAGQFVSAAFWALMAYDLYQCWYWMYVSTDGETEDGGYWPLVKADVEAWWKENEKPTVTAEPTVPAPVPLTTPAKAQDLSKSRPPAPAAPAPAPAAAASMSATPTTTAPPIAPQPPLDIKPGESRVVGEGNFKPYPMSAPSNEQRQSLKPSVVSSEIQTNFVAGLGFGGARKSTEAAVIHHTGGRSLDVAVKTLQSRGLSYHYLVDRDGKIVNILPDNIMAWHAFPTDKNPKVTNANSVSVSMIANDDKDVTPEQIASASSLVSKLSQHYGFSKSSVFGHGEIASGKMPTEGYTIANAIRGGTAPTAQELTQTSGPSFTGSSSGENQLQQTTKETDAEMDAMKDYIFKMLSDLAENSRGSNNTIINNNNIMKQSKFLDNRATESQLMSAVFERAAI